MWAILPVSGRSAVCGAAIEKENMEEHSSFDEVMAYGDDENVVQASLKLCADFIARRGSSRIRLGIEEALLPVGLFRAFKARFPEAELVEVGPWLEELRLVKSN